jgi:hypothetical protein
MTQEQEVEPRRCWQRQEDMETSSTGFPEWKIYTSPTRVDFEFCKQLPSRFSSMIVAHAMHTMVMVEGKVWTFGWVD